MPVFPSPEWIREFQDAVNASEAYGEAAKTWEGDFLFVVEPDGPLAEPWYAHVDLWHGTCRKAEVVPGPEAVATEFRWAGKYSHWQKVIRGELDPIKGLLMGRFRLKGNMAKVMRYTRAAKELVACIARVETTFVEAAR